MNEKEYLAPATFHEKGKPASEIIYSNVKELVQHQQYIFDTLWNKSISAEEKIKEIEDGIAPQIIDAIWDPFQLQKLAVNLGTSARHEILLLYSTAKAFLRQEKLGALLLLAEAVEAHSLKARILTPKDELIEQKVQIMKKQYPEKIDVLYIPEDLQTQVSILVVDRKSSLAVEIKDDSKDSSYEAMGLGVYSNRRATVSSYVSLFETLWRLSEMYKESQSQLLSAEDELANMKQYLNEVLKEVGSMRSKSN